MPKEGKRDVWKAISVLLGILIVALIVGIAVLWIRDGKKQAVKVESSRKTAELAAARPSEKELQISSDITVVQEGVKAEEESEKKKETASTESHRYEIIPRRMIWSDADSYCRSLGGYLATVTSQEEYNKILEVANASDRKVLWLGAQKGQDQNFKWITDEPFSYSFWLQNEPNNEGGRENCLVMFSVNGQWVWADVPYDLSPYYSENQVGFVCEYDE